MTKQLDLTTSKSLMTFKIAKLSRINIEQMNDKEEVSKYQKSKMEQCYLISEGKTMKKESR